MRFIQRHGSMLLCILLAAVFVIGAVPILAASFYAHPANDDYAYSARIHHLLESGQTGIGDVLSGAVETVKHFYKNWQGTFSAMFVMALQPAVFSEEMYCVTAFVMLFSLCIGTFMLFHVLAARVLKVKRVYAYICALICLFFSVQCIPSAHQAFYWWNGSIYYTFFYGVSLMLYACIIMLFYPKKKKNLPLTVFFACILSVLVGGSNFTTSLLSVEIAFLFTAYAFFRRKDVRVHMLIVFLLLLAAFLTSVLAPGNSIRAEETNGMNPVLACVSAVLYGGYYILKWTGFAEIGYLILITPAALLLARSKNFRFQKPLLVLVFGFLLFASQFAPALYGMGNVGAERQWNIYYYAYYLLITGLWVYLVGFAATWKKTEKLSEKIVSKKKYAYALSAVFLTLGIALYGVQALTGVVTAKSVLSGEARAYDERYYEMLSDIENADGICVTEGISDEQAPKFLSPVYLSEDADFWVNKQMENYFGLEEIRRR